MGLEKLSWLHNQDCKIIIDQLQDGIFVIDAGKIAYVNQRMATMLGYEVQQLIGRLFTEVVYPGDQGLVVERYHARIAGEIVPSQYDLHLVTAQGQVIYCSINVGLSTMADSSSVTIGSVRDVTLQKAELAELEASQEELKAIFNQLPDVFYRTNMQGIITLISPSCYPILGYRQEVMIGTLMSNYYLNPDERAKVVQAITEGGGKVTRVDAALRHKNGTTIWISTNAFVRYNGNSVPSYIEGVARDISVRKLMEDQLTALSRTDALTDVYSRRYFIDKSEAVIEMMKRYQRPASMMMMDLDHFKQINDRYGHHIGDLALIAFTKACRLEIRDADILGRLGGEEFGLMLPETSIQSAEILAERIRLATAAIEIPVADHTIRFTLSIGLVALNETDATLDEIMLRADHAMYQAKALGRNKVVKR